MLNGIGVIADGSVFQIDRCFDGIDLVVRDHHVVINHIIPCVSILDMIGIHRICHDVGEGFILSLIQAAGFQGRAVLADRPDFQVGRAVVRML